MFVFEMVVNLGRDFLGRGHPRKAGGRGSSGAKMRGPPHCRPSIPSYLITPG